MRKILLAGVALFSGAVATAHAQQVPANPSQGQVAAPYATGPNPMNNNNSWGIANTPSGSAAAGVLSTEYAPNANAVPAPGTIVIRLNGRVETDLSANFTSVDKGLTSTNGSSTATSNGSKLNPVGVGSYVRLYPGFDGVASNGLRYGASVELRENFYNATNTGSGTTASSSGANISAETIFVRRAFTYVANDQVGLLRIGQTDGVLGLFDNCIFTAQCWDAGSGTLNGGAMQQEAASGATAIPFVWLSQSAAEIGNSKIVYLSPQVYGFDLGVQYAPSMGNSFANAVGSSPIQTTSCNMAGANCINVSTGNDTSRWLNQVAVGLRYQHTYGPVDVKFYGLYETAGKEDLGIGSYATPSPTASVTALRYDNLSFYKAGTAITAYNVTASLDYIGGNVNGSLGMRPVGGAPMNAVLAGLTYANGPLTLGVSGGIINSQGDAALAGLSQRREEEMAVGGNYRFAPGLQVVLEYQYAQRHQGDFDFTTGTTGSTVDARAQGVMLATVLTW